MKSVALHNLGCKVNGYEVDVMQQILQENGYKIVPFDEEADIYIVNTCSVTNIADRKSRQMLHRAKKRNPLAVVVAVGCYVQTSREEALKDTAIDLLIGNNKKKDLLPLLEEFLESRENVENQRFSTNKTLAGKSVIDINAANEYENMTLVQTAEHTRAFIKIQDGCNQFCSYCIIPYARGRVRSRNIQDIAAEVNGLAERGYKEVVLTGIHISSYGADLDKSHTLLELIKEIHAIPGLGRIRLGSLEPGIITGEFAETVAGLSKVCPHFHLSLQSGCDATLQRMNRRYTSEEYYEKVQILREAYGSVQPAFTTDVIVGFPGETQEEFEETYAFLEKTNIFEMHVFKYSKRQGTRAAEMKNQVPESEKNNRSRRLLELNDRMCRSYLEQFMNREIEIIMEEAKEINGVIYQTGHTGEYVKAAKLSDDNREGMQISGTVTGFLTKDTLLMS